MHKALITHTAILAILLTGSLVSAQTTQPGDAIDIEIFNPSDGSNAFCVAPAGTIEARVFLRPGTGQLSCNLTCSPPNVPGGSANIATGVVDVAFDGGALSYVPGSIENNDATAAIQGLAQEQNIADDRIGWALAGNWSTAGDPTSNLLNPCDMQFVTAADWIFRMSFQAVGTGMSTLTLRGETDPQPFALSFADICGSEAFKASNAGIDEIKSAVVMVSTECGNVVFFDNFDTGGTDQWSGTAGS
jgi:hypothetical protein